MFRRLAGLVLVGLLLPQVASAAVFYRLSANEMGGATPLTAAGTLVLDAAGTGVDRLSLEVTTFGTLGFSPQVPAMHVFEYTAGDVAMATGLGAGTDGLTGIVDLVSATSTNGAVVIGGFMDGLRLDFTAGFLRGFCFSAADAECFAGGGTSTGFDVALETTVVPLPGSVVGLASAVAAMGVLRRRRARPMA